MEKSMRWHRLIAANAPRPKMKPALRLEKKKKKRSKQANGKLLQGKIYQKFPEAV